MTQEEKELLLKDLSARLPYNVKLRKYDSLNNYVNNCGDTTDDTLDAKLLYDIFERQYLGFRPYLRPISSMTEDERNELKEISSADYITDKYIDFGEFISEGSPIDFSVIAAVMDWLIAGHFDFRGLIEKGLAIDCTNLNIY